MAGVREIAEAVEPFLVLTYGPAGSGKTVDQGYSFPRALFVAAPGATTSITTICGYTPTIENVPTLAEAIKLIEVTSKSKKYGTIVFDDFSFLTQQTFSVLENKGKTGFKLWGEMRDLALEFRDKARTCNTNVVINCWETPPKTKPDGARVRGGPMLSGNLPEQVPAMCDIVLRAMHEPSRRPWPMSYRCSADPNYVMKDRFATAALVDPAPMNLAELLRASGRHVDRHPNLPNQEAEVTAIAAVLTGVPKDDMATANEIYQGLLKNYSEYVARWTMRDAMDRAVIRQAKRAASLYFFDPRMTHLLG